MAAGLTVPQSLYWIDFGAAGFMPNLNFDLIEPATVPFLEGNKGVTVSLAASRNPFVASTLAEKC
jgi:hypothetical protein